MIDTTQKKALREREVVRNQINRKMNPCKGETTKIRNEYIALSHTKRRETPRLKYKQFGHTKLLLQNSYYKFVQSHDNGNMKRSLHNLLSNDQLEGSDISKLFENIEKWNRIEIPIPIEYLDVLQITREQVFESLKADQNSFRNVVKMVHYPECFFANIYSGVIRVGLPGGTDEKEATKIAANYQTDEPIKGRYICIKDIKTIVIEPDKSHYTLTYPPILTFRNNTIIPCHGARKPEDW